MWAVPIIAAAVAYGIFEHRRRRARLVPLFESMASELQGRFTKGGLISHPRIHLAGEPEIGISILIGKGTQSAAGGITYAYIGYAPQTAEAGSGGQSRDFALRISRRHRSFMELVDSKIMPEASVGDPDFERDFVIRTRRPALARHVLTPDLKRDLARYPRSALLEVKFSKDECVVSTAGIAGSSDEIRRLAATSILLRKQMAGLLSVL